MFFCFFAVAFGSALLLSWLLFAVIVNVFVFHKQSYKCKKEAKCVINVTQHSCIACRYSRCLESGMIPRFIHLKTCKTTIKTSTLLPSTSPNFYRPLTAYEQKCLADLEQAGKVIPEELDLLAKGHEDPFDLISLSQGSFAYLKFSARYANFFELFRSLELSDRTRLIKTLYDSMITVRFAYNFDGNLHGIPYLSVISFTNFINFV